MNAAVEVRGLAKTFRGGVRALEGVDLTVAEGEIVALLGPNGAGKTTLLKILCSLILPDSGAARVWGRDAVEDPDGAKKGLSLVTGEEGGFYGRLTGRRNLEFFASLYGLEGAAAEERIGSAAAAFEIDFLDRPYQEFSTGMKHRLALARALVGGGGLLILDEPGKSLDPEAAARFRDMIRGFARAEKGRAVLLTTHDTGEAAALADRAAILAGGRLAACGTWEELGRLAGRPGADAAIIYRAVLERHAR